MPCRNPKAARRTNEPHQPVGRRFRFALRLALAAFVFVFVLRLGRQFWRLKRVHPIHQLVQHRDAVHTTREALDQFGVDRLGRQQPAKQRRRRVMVELAQHAGLVERFDHAAYRHHDLGLGLHLAHQMRPIAIAIAECRSVGDARHIDGPAFYTLLRRIRWSEQQMRDGPGGRAERQGERVAQGELHQ